MGLTLQSLKGKSLLLPSLLRAPAISRWRSAEWVNFIPDRSPGLTDSADFSRLDFEPWHYYSAAGCSLLHPQVCVRTPLPHARLQPTLEVVHRIIL